jgi:hypothetical protein
MQEPEQESVQVIEEVEFEAPEPVVVEEHVEPEP